MKYLLALLICFTLFVPHSSANEAMLQNIQNQMASMQEYMKSLESTVLDLRKTVENQNEVIQNQNMRLQNIEGSSTAGSISNVAYSGSPSKENAVPLAGLSQGFNPDIGVVGTVQALLTEDSEDAEGKDTITLKELELSFSQYVDPYSRLDAIIALNDNLEDQNIDIEEAYYTHWGLPWGFVGTLGKFRTKVGKENLVHLHALDLANYSLVVRNFFGEEGMSSSGARLQNYLPNPFDLPIQVTGEILRGNNGDSFSGISRRPIFNTHISSYFELSESMNLELGGTWMNGDENVAALERGQDRFGVHIFGSDATILWELEEGRKIKWQNEIYFQSRANQADINSDPWGFYSLVDFEMNEKFSVGVRFDYLEPRNLAEGNGETTEVSPYITFRQSEFANFRLQYSHVEPADPSGDTDDAIYLQANFLIGAHSHPVV
jgi:hypothetical protein